MSFRSQSKLVQTAFSDSDVQTDAPSEARITVSITPLDDLSAYRGLAGDGLHAPAQHPLWIEDWVACTDPDGFVATVQRDHVPVLALALEIQRSGPFRIARFMGGSHANGNFPVLNPVLLQASPLDMRPLLSAIQAKYPRLDALVLDRLTPCLEGCQNPLMTLPHFPDPTPALAVDLAGGFDALLERTSAKRKRKRHRSQIRKFEAAGGFRRIEASSPEEVTTLLDAFFAMKEARFRKMGIANVFGDTQVRNFFRALFRDALSEKPKPFMLHALEVGGKLRAVTGSSRAGTRIVCEFGAIGEDELSAASPGEFLFFDNIEEACAQGFDVYDFSVGDEPYKRQWCDIEMRLFNVVVPLTFRGRALAAGLRAKIGLKAAIKNSPAVWKLAKMLRRARGKKREPADS